MIEVSRVRQIPGEPMRRWFSSAEFDLFVHYGEAGELVGFQLCYDKRHRERAVVYGVSEGYRHMTVDDGEGRPGKYKASPVYTAEDNFDALQVYLGFSAAATGLPAEVAAYVRQLLARHPGFPVRE